MKTILNLDHNDSYQCTQIISIYVDTIMSILLGIYCTHMGEMKDSTTPQPQHTHTFHHSHQAYHIWVHSKISKINYKYKLLVRKG